MTPTVLHLFAGSGGCTLGFQRAGFRSLGSLDFDAVACRDLERLTGGPAFCRDLARIEPAELRDLTAGECPDVVVMSPPCKSFSGCMPAARASEARYIDMSQLATRGMFLALEAWAPARPKLLLLENVPRIQTRGAELLAQIIGLLHASGYATDQRTHDCGELGGLAQHRQRFLLVARDLDACPDFLALVGGRMCDLTEGEIKAAAAAVAERRRQRGGRRSTRRQGDPIALWRRLFELAPRATNRALAELVGCAPAVIVDARHRVELAAAAARGDDRIRLVHRSQRP